MAEDYYKILGVRRNASQAEIQKAYRTLARKYHPDMNPGDKDATKKFQRVQQAFDVLNDPQKREMYDRYGSAFETMGAGRQRSGPWGPGQAGPGPGGFDVEGLDLGDILGEQFAGMDLGQIFGRPKGARGSRTRRSTGNRRRRGANLEAQIEVPFVTAVAGGSVDVTIPRPLGGAKRLSVKVPPGIEEGAKIRLRAQGEQIPGGTAGDAVLTVHVLPHPHFQRQGNNLVLRVPVTLAEAALGAKVTIPTPKGDVTLRIPAGSSSHTRLRMKGYGVAPKKGPAGDLFAEIQIVLPNDLDDATRDLIRRADERRQADPRAKLRW